ncbi:hypothetical protein ACE939_07045 [Aquimarina sp. W85]|uniref:hypothetical protein n=1 Tax=Aquimarina rhodophyticola TaxID=3342246 RepID=UPI00366A67B1
MIKKFPKSFLILFTFALSLLACDAVDDLLTFTITDDIDFEVSSGIPISTPFEISTPPVESNSKSEFENNNSRVDLVKEIKLKSLNLAITSPEGKTFSFLKSIKIFISDSNDKNEIELASLDTVPEDAKTISLETTNTALDAYVKGSSYNLRTEVVTRETLTETVAINAEMKYQVTADPL